jgi:hypothetical protein
LIRELFKSIARRTDISGDLYIVLLLHRVGGLVGGGEQAGAPGESHPISTGKGFGPHGFGVLGCLAIGVCFDMGDTVVAKCALNLS